MKFQPITLAFISSSTFIKFNFVSAKGCPETTLPFQVGKGKKKSKFKGVCSDLTSMKWAARKNVCNNVKDLAQTCPETCWKCNDAYECKDSKAKLTVLVPKKKGNGLQKKKITCKKIKKKIEYYCPMEGVTYACPETCGLCDSNEPSSSPSHTPSVIPSTTPSLKPSSMPSVTPSLVPSAIPSTTPSLVPSTTPSLEPSVTPSLVPSAIPSITPSTIPSLMPSTTPSLEPSVTPSQVPSLKPSQMPSLRPSQNPSLKPSQVPSILPSTKPSQVPSIFYTPFSSTGDLQTAVTTYCNNPADWVNQADYNTYGPIENWKTSAITDMSSVFEGMTNCNPNITQWDVSQVTKFSYMFFQATSFNSDISGWNVSAGTNFDYMFSGASNFNQDLCRWKTDYPTNLDPFPTGFCTYAVSCGTC